MAQRVAVAHEWEDAILSKDGPHATTRLALAAHALGLSWTQAWSRVLKGELAGEKRGGRWFVRVPEDRSARAESASAPPADDAK